mgnify:CR=1 FL=1
MGSSRPSRPIFTSTRTRTRTFVFVATVLVVFALAATVLRWTVPGITDPQWLTDWIEGAGWFAPVAFVALQATQIVVAPIPGQLVAFVGGYAFGAVHGTIYSLLGAAIGSTIVFLLARRYGRLYVERAIHGETLAAFDNLVSRDGRFALFLVFLLPGLPDDAICFLAGVTRIPVRQLVAISLLGRAPGYLLVSYAGTQFAAANYPGTTAILVGLAAVSVVVYWKKDTVIAFLEAV